MGCLSGMALAARFDCHGFKLAGVVLKQSVRGGVNCPEIRTFPSQQ